MGLFIDTPRWEWRGQLWAHLISDDSLEELHVAARDLNLRWVSFGRDHYDVPDHRWADACAIAELVDSRDIVRSLRRSGLRVHGGKPKKTWQWLARLPDPIATPQVLDWLDQVQGRLGQARVETLGRPTEVVVLHLLDGPDSPDLNELLDPPVPGARVVETVADGRYSVELILEWQSPAA